MTESMIVWRSSGRIVRRLITSAETPIAASSSAACSAVWTPREYETIVTSVPSRSILHSPIGTVKSGPETAGETGKDMP